MPNFIDLPAYMQVGQRELYRAERREGNVVSGGTAGTTGVVTLNGNEVTLKNSQLNCGGYQGCQPSIQHT